MLALRLGLLLVKALLPKCCLRVQILMVVLIIIIISTTISHWQVGRCLEYQRLGMSLWRLGLWECCARQRLGLWGWHRLGLWVCGTLWLLGWTPV